MAIEVRGARREEYPEIQEILVRAFRHGAADEGPQLTYLLENDTAMEPACTRVALLDGRPVACTVVLPRRVRTRRGVVDGAELTLVACLPDVQGQGYGGATVRDALRFAAERGLAVAGLWGHPGYYPRFGFAPVQPSYETVVELKHLPEDSPAEALLPVTEADLPGLCAHFERDLGGYLLVISRRPEMWLWQTRRPDLHATLTLAERQGYAFVTHSLFADKYDVHEAAAATPEAGRRLLAALVAEARRLGREQVRLLMPPDHLLCRLALLGKAQVTYRTASAGMATVTLWEKVLPLGYSLTGEGLALEGRPVLIAPRPMLTQMTLGYRSAADALLAPDVTLVEEGLRGRLEADFPPVTVRWAVEPFVWWQ